MLNKYEQSVRQSKMTHSYLEDEDEGNQCGEIFFGESGDVAHEGARIDGNQYN